MPEKKGMLAQAQKALTMEFLRHANMMGGAAATAATAVVMGVAKVKWAVRAFPIATPVAT